MKRNKLIEIRHRRENGQKEPKIMNKKQFLKWSRLGSTETHVYTHTHNAGLSVNSQWTGSMSMKMNSSLHKLPRFCLLLLHSLAYSG